MTGQLDEPRRPALVDRGHLLHGQELGAEARRLRRRPAGEVGAGQAHREAEVVLDPRALAGLAAGRLALDQRRPQPFRRAVDRGRKPGRPAADDDEVVELELRPPPHAGPLGEVGHARAVQHAAVGEQDERQRRVAVGGREQPPGLVVALDVEPAVRHLVAGQEVAGVVRLARPAVADHLDAVGVGGRIRPPGIEQVVHDRVELLVGRIPRLQQVVVERHAVDRVDRGLRVGVGGQEHPLGLGREPHRLLQELDARHLGHALVGQEQRDRRPAQLGLAHRGERRPRRSRPAGCGSRGRSGGAGRARPRGPPMARRRRRAAPAAPTRASPARCSRPGRDGERHLVLVAPEPVLARLGRADHGMAALRSRGPSRAGWARSHSSRCGRRSCTSAGAASGRPSPGTPRTRRSSPAARSARSDPYACTYPPRATPSSAWSNFFDRCLPQPRPACGAMGVGPGPGLAATTAGSARRGARGSGRWPRAPAPRR